MNELELIEKAYGDNYRDLYLLMLNRCVDLNFQLAALKKPNKESEHKVFGDLEIKLFEAEKQIIELKRKNETLVRENETLVRENDQLRKVLKWYKERVTLLRTLAADNGQKAREVLGEGYI